MHALALVQLNDALGAGNGAHGVKAQTRVYLGGNAPRHMLENFAAKTHQQVVHGVS